MQTRPHTYTKVAFQVGAVLYTILYTIMYAFFLLLLKDNMYNVYSITVCNKTREISKSYVIIYSTYASNTYFNYLICLQQHAD